jgi:hypothetical protein
MTTVVDPTGTPAIVYNRSGTTIATVVGGTTSTPSFPIGNEGIDIPRLSETTVVLGNTVPNSGNDVVFRLPTDAEIGDIVEVYYLGGGSQTPWVFPQVGDQIIPSSESSTGTNSAAGFNIGQPFGSRFRKVSSSTWVAIGTPA